jgi:hypothetical protein
VSSNAAGRREVRPIRYVVLSLVAVAFFCVTMPQNVPSVLLIAGFLVLGILFYSVLKLLLISLGLERRLSTGHKRIIVATGVVLPLILLSLQSVGQLTLRDFLTLLGICLLGGFYISRLRS